MTANPYRLRNEPNKPVKLITHDGHTCIVDSYMFDLLNYMSWQCERTRSSYYAYTYLWRHGRKRKVWMHRLVAFTPASQVCHHVNRDSLNNCRCNLRNMTREEHHAIHNQDTVILKFQ